jgi:hypothetical protein
MSLFIVLIIIIATIFIYNFLSKPSIKEIEQEQRQTRLNEAAIREVTEKQFFFEQFKDFLYKHLSFIDTFITESEFKIILTNAYPSYGLGKFKKGILEDLERFDLIEINKCRNVILGDVFKVIKLAYPNFYECVSQLEQEGMKFYWEEYEGKYFAKKNTVLVSIILENSNEIIKYYFGIYPGEKLLKIANNHKNSVDIKEGCQYLFMKLSSSKNLYNFACILLPKDLSVEEYKNIFNTGIDQCKINLSKRALNQK